MYYFKCVIKNNNVSLKDNNFIEAILQDQIFKSKEN